MRREWRKREKNVWKLASFDAECRANPSNASTMNLFEENFGTLELFYSPQGSRSPNLGSLGADAADAIASDLFIPITVGMDTANKVRIYNFT